LSLGHNIAPERQISSAFAVIILKLRQDKMTYEQEI